LGAVLPAGRPRRRRISGAELVETLNEMVTQLIKENRSLKRQLAKLTAGGATAINGSAERTLRLLQRKVQRAVSAPPVTRRRRTTTASTTARPRTTTRRRSAPAAD
jgi:hypothetical protein